MATSITGFNTNAQRDEQDIWHFDVDRNGVLKPFEYTLMELIAESEHQALIRRFRQAELQLRKNEGVDSNVLNPIRVKILKAQNNIAELHFAVNIIAEG